MSIHIENPLSTRSEILVLICVFLCVCFLPFIGVRELFGRESEFAAIASEISWRAPWPIAQGELLPYRYPLFPLLIRSLTECGLTAEWAVRLISIFALGMMAVLNYIATVKALRNTEAGAIAAVVVLSNVFIIDRGTWGYPELLGYLFIQTAWFLWFHFGMTLHNWNRAWFFATIFCFLSFATIGPGGGLLFILPILFMKRPVSGISRIGSVSGILAFVVFFALVLLWEAARSQFGQEASTYQVLFSVLQARSVDVIWRIFSPFDIFVRLLPWSIMIYTVFCPAYAQFETNPVFTRFNRTILIVVLVSIILIPWYRIADEVRILLPVFGYLTAVHYTVYIRRNGTWIARILKPLKALLLLTSLILLGYHFFFPQLAQLLQKTELPQNGILPQVLSYFQNLWIQFTLLQSLTYTSMGIAICSLILALILISRPGRAMPIWAQIALLMAGASLLYWGSNSHRRMFDRSQNEFAQKIRESLIAAPTSVDTTHANITLYKDPMLPQLYAEGVYLKYPIIKTRLQNLDNVVTDTLYYLSGDVPVPTLRYRWSDKPLFKHVYNDRTIFLWSATQAPKDTTRAVLPTNEPNAPIYLLP